MSVDTKIPLRDFDGETDDDTDSETELLIRHHVSGSGGDGQNTTTRKLNNSSQQHYGSYSNNHHHQQRKQNNKPSFLSQLFGVVGGTTTFSSSSGYATNSNQQQPLRSSTSSPSLARDGQIRFRNERSRERSHQTTNITASQTINNAAQAAAKFGQHPKSKSSYNLNTSPNQLDSSSGYSDSLQMSAMDATQPNITATTSPHVNGVMQTVIDPENGSTTVFYQKNRRKSKKRSMGNLCKMCLCG